MTEHAAPTREESETLLEAVERALEAAGSSRKPAISAAILKDGVVISRGENEVHRERDPTRHAEVVAISAAAKRLGSSDLSGCTLVTTLQPCEMCLGAMRFAGISRVVFAAQKNNVAGRYFMFPSLEIGDFAAASKAPLTAIGGVHEARVLHLYG